MHRKESYVTPIKVNQNEFYQELHYAYTRHFTKPIINPAYIENKAPIDMT